MLWEKKKNNFAAGLGRIGCVNAVDSMTGWPQQANSGKQTKQKA